MRIAALDLGTNTFLCLIAEVEEGVITKVISDQATTVRLGQDVHRTRRFHVEALQRADECFAKYAQDIKAANVDVTLALATSASRDVENADELFKIGEKYQIPIKVISGDEEAQCTFFGTVDGPMTEPIAIIDVGGGSTEFILGDRQGLRFKKSLDIGSVRLTELFIKHDKITITEMADVTHYITEKIETLKVSLAEHSDVPTPHKVVAVSGTPTILAALDMGLPFNAETIHGYELTLQKMQEWIMKLAAMPLAERKLLAGMEEKRADVIVAGLLILLQSAEVFKIPHIEVSVRGLRYGIAKQLSTGRLKV